MTDKICVYLGKGGSAEFPKWCAWYGKREFTCKGCKYFVERREG